MLHIGLWEPEIPPNTGNIARLCAATGATLHLIGRLGFRVDDRSLRRAGLDYWDAVQIHQHASLDQFEEWFKAQSETPPRWLCLSAHASRSYTQMAYQPEDILLFGSESRGLPANLLERNPEQNLTIPMPAGKVRSLNLANAVGIVLYEALRQLHQW